MFPLKPLTWLFGAIVQNRGTFYKHGWLKTQDLQMPTISIGNITVGGTGKTPLVISVAEILAQTGRKPCVLTRGYKRANPNEQVIVSDGKQILADAPKAGDEPFEIARRLLGKAAVIADKNRFEAGKRAIENLACDSFILDDGFQHLQLKRDLDILAIDATNPFGNAKLLPAGILREPLKNLNRADLFVITRADLIESEKIEALKIELKKFNQTAPILTARNKITKICALQDFLISENPPSAIQNPQSGFAFCGLGNPENFYQTLRRANVELQGFKNFPDHYAHTQKDISELEEIAEKKGAKILLTTAKDAVKLAKLHFNLPCFVVEIETVFDDEKTWREGLLKTLLSH